ncbi:MAG: folylpolyglutamate synthase/dihydrofolate synthase family protein [Dehalococcoidia bacterium]
MDFREAIQYLQSFNDMERGVQKSPNPVMSVASVRSLLARLQDPHLGRLTVHVTGSKGKGSTASMIAGILRRAGLGTTLYTSPHLHSYTERINIHGDAVSPAEFAAALGAIRSHVEDERESVHGAVSTFGVLTALFFWLTRAQVPRVDAQVVEVGIGGAFDATNVFESPDVVVITPISLEHTAILGDTTLAIARDKSALVKPGSLCVLAPQKDPQVVDLVRHRCEEVGAEFVDVSLLYDVEPVEHFPYGQSFIVRGPEGPYEMRTPMLGRHQMENAATAVAVAEALQRRGQPITASAIVDGVALTRVPGRLEVMGQKPLVVADGAHNAESAAALADALKQYFAWKKCYFVLGAMQDKDIRSIGFKLARLAEVIVCARIASPRSMDPFAMIQEVGFLGPMAVAEESMADAIDTALSYAGEQDLVCVTGSLYAVAEAREHVLGESVHPS